MHAAHDHAEGQARVELDGLGVFSRRGAWQASLQHRQDLFQTVLSPSRQTRDQKGERKTGAGASDDTGGVLTRVGALGRRKRGDSISTPSSGSARKGARSEVEDECSLVRLINKLIRFYSCD